MRLLPCVLDALARIAARRKISRDEAVRQVLAEHLDEQEAREPEDRVTHISTILRYPPPPRGTDRVDLQLRLRLPAGMADRARAVSLMLPGQHRRAYRDYQARALTDAVVTAIAVQELFTDEVLDGLLPLLRHKAALGLWQLVIAATSSWQELRIQDAATAIRARPPAPFNAEDDRMLRIAETLDEEVSWHSQVRFKVAGRLAAENLRGEGAAAFEETLYAQRAPWSALRDEHRFSRHGREWFDGNYGGRGATAVWRAKRKVELHDFEDWLSNTPGEHSERHRVINPPGWLVGMPTEWHATALPQGRELPAQVARWAEAGQVLVLALRGRRVVWPLRSQHGSPVADAEPLVAAARTLKAQDLVPFVESMLIEWDTPLAVNDEPAYGAVLDSDEFHGEPIEDEDELSEAKRRWTAFDARYSAPQLWLPVEKAFRLGLVDAAQRRDAMAAARRDNLERTHYRRLGEAQLVAPVTTKDPRICLFIPRVGKNRLAKPMWQWQGGSVARAAAAQADPGLVQCLVDAALWTTGWTLQRTMHQVWRSAFR